MTTLNISYSEDFRKSEISRVVYARLRGVGVDPISVNSIYNTSKGTFDVDFVLPERNVLPVRLELEEMFRDLNLMTLDVKETEKFARPYEVNL